MCNQTYTQVYGETTLEELRNLPEFRNFGKFFVWRGKTEGFDESAYDLRQHAYESRGGEITDFLKGIHRMQTLIAEGVRIDHDFWTTEEVEAEPDRAETKLFFFPCGDAGKPFVMFIGGGAYEDVYSLGQAFPCAARANELGYNAFVLSYRCIHSNTKGIMPKPIDDLAKALSFIFSSPEKFPVSREGYALCGFSAGGHLAAEWGTVNRGYRKYKLPAPSAIVLCFAMTVVDEQIGERPLNSMFGDKRDSAYIRSYSVVENMDESFPPTYMYHCKNDAILPFEQSAQMDKALSTYGIDHVFVPVERGYHGYGLGSGCQVEGWLEKAITFWQQHM